MKSGFFMLVGILAFQGGVIEHKQMLGVVGAKTVEIRTPRELRGIDALVFPGGESTHLSKELDESGLTLKIFRLIKKGLPVFGTCAGAILLSKKVDGKKGKFPFVDISIKRNAYGRQVESFEAKLKVSKLGWFPGVFIRAPIIESIGKKAEALAFFNGKPVLVRQKNVLVATFHPELSGNKRLHEFFLQNVALQ